MIVEGALSERIRAKSMRDVETPAGFGSLETMKGILIDKIESEKALESEASAEG